MDDRRFKKRTIFLIAYLVDQSGLIRIDPSVYFIDRLPVHVEPRDVLIVIVASVCVSASI